MKEELPQLADRLRVRERPSGSPIIFQSWGKLLFMHWQIPAAVIRQFIPDRLKIDTFEDNAWIAVTPFTMWDVRPIFTPPLPWVSSFHEINVRTYVFLDGVPGVWFFSLDANSAVAVKAARAFFHLLYQKASISLEQLGQRIVYVSTREGAGSGAQFRADWTIGEPLPEAEPGSLEFFLVERYCLYSSYQGKLYRCRIHHQPWPLQRASLSAYHSNLIEADRLPTPTGQPLVHCGGPVKVEVWKLEQV
jgi:uncharacterized protein YqjF (DUF2071 family)